MRFSKHFPLTILLILLTTGLSACFRDAGNGKADPTRVNANQLRPTATVTATATQNLPPTFTTEPTVAATKTLGAGGPAGDDDSTATTDPTATELAPEDVTLAPPGFGDAGLSPTPNATATSSLPPLEATPTSIEEPDECIYTVQGGDTLYSIAAEYDLFPEDFYPVNPQLQANPNALQIGDQIRIPGCVSEGTPTTEAPAAGTPATTPVPTGLQSYTVQEGDTLYSIAVRFNVTVQDIVDATEFLVSENTIIRPGDVLMIPVSQ